jgi:hypothetical protein
LVITFVDESDFLVDVLLLLDDDCDVGMFEDVSLLRLKLESLRSLRADEKPLELLVRFDNCVFGHSVDLSLLEKIFNFPNIDCLVGVCCCSRFPFDRSVVPFCDEYGELGILLPL